MEKLNIVWIKKWKIKRNLISVMTKIKAFFEKTLKISEKIAGLFLRLQESAGFG